MLESHIYDISHSRVQMASYTYKYIWFCNNINVRENKQIYSWLYSVLRLYNR